MQKKEECAVGPLSELFVCLNKYNKGAHIQQPKAAALLWSGSDGELQAEDAEKFQKSKMQLAYLEPKQELLHDHSVKACKANLDVIRKIFKGHSLKDKRFMFFGINFLWFIWNSDPQQHGNTIRQWTSLKAYESIDEK